MATRTITGTLHHATGTAWVGATVTFAMERGTFTVGPDVTFMQDGATAVTDSDGEFSVTLTSGLDVYWRCSLPDGDGFRFALPVGAATTLEALRSTAEGLPVLTSSPLGLVTVFNLHDYGAAGDGVTDDSVALTAAIAAADAEDGGVIYAAPGRYMFPSGDEPFELVSNITLMGVPGQTIFDFSGRADFANDTTKGLIRALGTTEDSVALTEDARPYPVPVVIKSTSTQPTYDSGTNRVTFTTETDHGLSVGDYIVVDGASGAIAQRGYSSVSITNVPTRHPFKVLSVPSSTTFTYAPAEALDAAFTGGEMRVWGGGESIVCTSTTGFAADDLVIVASEYQRDVGTNEAPPIGEFNVVENVVDGTAIRLRSTVRDTYAVADSATIRKVNPVENVTIEGITFVGKGANTAAGLGDTCLKFELCRNITVRDCTFIDVDLLPMSIDRVENGLIDRNTIYMPTEDIAGRIGANPDLQYAVGWSGVQNFTMSRNTVYGGRHAFVQGNTSTVHADSEEVIARKVSIVDNHSVGCWQAHISTHIAHADLLIQGNTCHGGAGGVSVRWGDGVVIKDNILRGFWGSGIELQHHLYASTIQGNLITGSRKGIVLDAETFADTVPGTISVTDNVMFDLGDVGIEMDARATDQILEDLLIANNVIARCGGSGIDLYQGITSTNPAGWTGIVADNILHDIGVSPATATRYGIRGGNARYCQFKGNHIRGFSGGTMTYGIRIEGTQNVGNTVDGNYISGYVTSDVSLSGGSGNVVDPGGIFDAGNLTIASGVLTLPAVPPKTTLVRVSVDTEAAAASDDLDTFALTGTVPVGTLLLVRSVNAGRNVVVKSGGAGVLWLSNGLDHTLDRPEDNILLRYTGTDAIFAEVARSPVFQRTAYTQTFSTADKTHAAATATTVTNAFGTADGTLEDVSGAHDQTILNNNFKELTTQTNALIADVADVKELVNAVIDDLQALGFVG